MTDKTKKSERPSCACGKTDLYEEWLKKENNKEEVADLTMDHQEGEENISTEGSSGQDQKTN